MPCDVPFRGVKPFRFQEHGMALLVREAHDFVLDGGAVARPRAVDGAGVHGRAVQVGKEDFVRFLRWCRSDSTGRGCSARGVVREEGKRRNRLVARLRLHLGKVDGAAVHARGRAGLEAADGKAQADERVRERRWRPAAPAARPVPRAWSPMMNAAFQIHAPRTGSPRGQSDARARGGGPRRRSRPFSTINAGTLPPAASSRWSLIVHARAACARR